ncbi:cysteine-rich venom protein 1-like [Rhinoderma darwinii]|uniref:cysteine-rich venom protein 1-like n=1 Tax=Rhinoderma darwinii TaxID=43563 RepID=UPI003F662D1A
MLKVCTLFVLFSLVLHSMASSDQHDCSAHQIYRSCGSDCPANCDNYYTQLNKACSFNCKDACFCVPPYIFKSGKSGECIMPSFCPRRFHRY